MLKIINRTYLSLPFRRRSMIKKLVEVEAVIEHETDGAYLLDFGGKWGPEWVPKAVTQVNGDGTFTLPEKMAIDKGMI